MNRKKWLFFLLPQDIKTPQTRKMWALSVRNAGVLFVAATSDGQESKLLFSVLRVSLFNIKILFLKTAMLHFELIVGVYSSHRIYLCEITGMYRHAFSTQSFSHDSHMNLTNHTYTHTYTHIPSAVIVSGDKGSFPLWSLALRAPTTLTYNGPVF